MTRYERSLTRGALLGSRWTHKGLQPSQVWAVYVSKDINMQSFEMSPALLSLRHPNSISDDRIFEE